MDYRRLGRSGLKVSALSFGSWVSFGNQLDARTARECLAAARDAGVNFFDNAEVYASGHSETLMGEAFRALKWPRLSYVVSTKFYWGLSTGPNQDHTLNRKYLLESIDGSLQRFGLDHVDLVYCHRPDPNTPVEETVWAMHDIIARGKALYWGTSNGPPTTSASPGTSRSATTCTNPSSKSPNTTCFIAAAWKSNTPAFTGIPVWG